MTERTWRHALTTCCMVGLSWFGGACTSAPPPAEALPFHVAVMPVVISGPSDDIREARALEGEINLSFASESLDENLVRQLTQRFVRVTPLTGEDLVAENGQPSPAAFAAARTAGADLILEPRLTYQADVETELNDRFWPNLVLYAIGGPLNWLVADRSYQFRVELSGELVDVAAQAQPGTAPSAAGLVARLTSESTEASLNFIERIDGVIPFTISLVLPSGLVAARSTSVPGELQYIIGNQLTNDFSVALQDRRQDLLRPLTSDFFPRNVATTDSASGPVLRGEFVLREGATNEFAPIGYRFAPGQWQRIEFGRPKPDTEGRGDAAQLVFPFEIPWQTGAFWMQVEIERLGTTSRTRSFTYLRHSRT